MSDASTVDFTKDEKFLSVLAKYLEGDGKESAMHALAEKLASQKARESGKPATTEELVAELARFFNDRQGKSDLNEGDRAAIMEIARSGLQSRRRFLTAATVGTVAAGTIAAGSFVKGLNDHMQFRMPDDTAQSAEAKVKQNEHARKSAEYLFITTISTLATLVLASIVSNAKKDVENFENKMLAALSNGDTELAKALTQPATEKRSSAR